MTSLPFFAVAAPETVVAVHRDYIDAGARIIITNSYATIPSYLAKLDMANSFSDFDDIGSRITVTMC